LLGEERFPEDMVLTLMLSASKDATTNRIMSLPWLTGRTPYHKFVADPLRVALYSPQSLMTYITESILPLVEALGALLFFIPIMSVLSFFAALLTWKFVLRSTPLRLGGSVLILAVSASSACGVYGHIAGPVAWLAFAAPS
jgi:hypothetical protein